MIKNKLLFNIYRIIIQDLIISLLDIFGNNDYIIKLKQILYSPLFKNIGKNVIIKKGVIFKNTYNIEIGNNCSINEYCYIDGSDSLYIGNNTRIAHHSSILTSSHIFNKNTLLKKEWYKNMEYKPVYIGDNTWIGMGVRILYGTNIEGNCIIGANALVNKNITKFTINGGIPSKIIKDIN